MSALEYLHSRDVVYRDLKVIRRLVKCSIWPVSEASVFGNSDDISVFCHFV